MLNPDHEVILGILTSRGFVSSTELQAATGRSQATVSRLLSDLAGRVLTLGRARATRYALPRLIRGLPAQQPMLWTAEDGAVRQIGVLSFLGDGSVHVDSELVPATVSKELPWFLSPLRAQGFLGRLHARRLEAAGLGANPEQWDLESVLFSALHLHDTAGAITLGDPVRHQPLSPLMADDEPQLAAALDRMADTVAETLPAGSSAAGEQPKFLALLEGGRHVLVKFSPPRGTPFGDRWHDLLHAECLAASVLHQHGVQVASSRIVESRRRTFLVSDRFDRIGAHGRLHAVSVGDIHRAFVADRYSHWAATAQALSRQGRLSALQAEQVAALRAFGQLIGNTDMHSGNLSFFVTLEDLAKGRFTLAPVYDMLPMRWRPDPVLGGAGEYGAFEPEAAAVTGPAAGPALAFWQRLQAHAPVSAGLRRVAAEMTRRIPAVL